MTGDPAIAAGEASDARQEREKYWYDWAHLNFAAAKHFPSVDYAVDDDGVTRLSGDRDECEAYAEILTSEYGWTETDVYQDEVPGTGQQYWIVELERQ